MLGNLFHTLGVPVVVVGSAFLMLMRVDDRFGGAFSFVLPFLYFFCFMDVCISNVTTSEHHLVGEGIRNYYLMDINISFIKNISSRINKTQAQTKRSR
jgi:hypothetical protein